MKVAIGFYGITRSLKLNMIYLCIFFKMDVQDDIIKK